jgi:hypothetical protein
MNLMSKLYLSIFLLYASNSYADLNGCNTSCSPDGAGGSVCNTRCPQSNQGTFMDGYYKGQQQMQQLQLMRQRLDLLKQIKQACDQGNAQACTDYRVMLMNIQ